MKIKTFAFRGATDQISRIESGFISLGCEIINNDSDEPDIIYANNPLYSEVLEYSKKFPKAKKIFTVLDIPNHCPGYPFDTLISQLKQADAICTISQTVEQQLFDQFGLKSTVIYQPAKPVYHIPNTQKTNKFLYVGRALDSNKRLHLVKEYMQKNGFNETDLIVVGTENPGFGIYYGVVSDQVLNELYNKSEYVFLPSKVEGIGLPGVESIICKTPIIMCNDNPTAIELIGESLVCEPTAEGITKNINSLLWQKEMEYRLEEWSDLAKKVFSPARVARRILRVYESIK